MLPQADRAQALSPKHQVSGHHQLGAGCFALLAPWRLYQHEVQLVHVICSASQCVE